MIYRNYIDFILSTTPGKKNKGKSKPQRFLHVYTDYENKNICVSLGNLKKDMRRLAQIRYMRDWLIRAGESGRKIDNIIMTLPIKKTILVLNELWKKFY